jgi:hypothetical protein
LYLHNGVWEDKQVLPSAWIDKVSHANLNMHLALEPGLRYSNLFWALPDKHVYMGVGYHRQVIMVFPDLDVVVVTTGRDRYPLTALAEYVSSSVKSDGALPADEASTNLLANKIREVSTEKPTAVGPTPALAAAITGKVYRFAPNAFDVKSLSLTLTGPQPHYDLEMYAEGTPKSAPRVTGPIGLDGLYRKDELIHGHNERLEGPPWVNAAKGTWKDDHTFIVDRLVLGQGEPPERWTLTFVGERLNLQAGSGRGTEVFSIAGETGE